MRTLKHKYLIDSFRNGFHESINKATANWGFAGILIAIIALVFTVVIAIPSCTYKIAFFYAILAGIIFILFYYMYYVIISFRSKKETFLKLQEKIQELERKIKEIEQKTDLQTKIIDKLKEEEGYGLAIRELYIAFSILNQYFYKKRSQKEKSKDEAEDEIKNIIKSFCNCLSEIYTKKIGAKCSVSIKLIEGNFEKHRLESIVKNFERDKDSTDRDNDKNYSEHEHKVSNNTCFYEIVNGFINSEEDSLFYINPSLSKDVKYKTSSLDCKVKHLSRKEKKKNGNGLKDLKERPKIWNKYISYESEIVVPLLLANKPFESGLLGFLCLDSEIENAFNEEFDIPLIKGVADGIYEIITDFKSLV